MLDDLRTCLLALLRLLEVEDKALCHQHFFSVVEEVRPVDLGPIMGRRYELHRMLKLHRKRLAHHLRVKLPDVALHDTFVGFI